VLSASFSLPLEPALQLFYHVSFVDQHSIFLGVTIWQPHFLDLDLPLGKFIFAQDDCKGYAVSFCIFELFVKPWLVGIEVFRLASNP
jgi:hypothetical protein